MLYGNKRTDLEGDWSFLYLNLQLVSEHCTPITSALFSYIRLLSAHIFAQSLVIVSRTKAFQFMINIKLAAYLWMLQIIA